MKYTVRKIYTIGAYEKEEKWLNEMASKGMMLTDVGFCRYVFEEGTPGEYIYRLELLNHLPSHAESVAYIKFFEETGVEYVSSILCWVYFRKKAEDGFFEIYSDIDSRIKHYKRVTFIANIASIFLVIASIIYFWEAWNQYSVYEDWYKRGFSCDAYHLSYIITGILYLALIIMLQCIVVPVRKAMHLLKKEQKIRE